MKKLLEQFKDLKNYVPIVHMIGIGFCLGLFLFALSDCSPESKDKTPSDISVLQVN